MEVLLIEDNLELSSFVEKGLYGFGHKVFVESSIQDFLSGEKPVMYDVIILDLMLGEEKGEDFLRYMRKENINIPVIILSSLSSVEEKVSLLKVGADDYMTKPFDISELNARIEALYRRYLDVVEEEEEHFADVVFYWKQNRVVRAGVEIKLTQKEGELLKFLVMNRNKTVRYSDILNKVWKAKVGYHSNVLQSMVRRLRRKLDGPFDYDLITNVHGVGYVLNLSS